MVNKIISKLTIDLCIFIFRKSYLSSTSCYTRKRRKTTDAFEERLKVAMNAHHDVFNRAKGIDILES